MFTIIQTQHTHSRSTAGLERPGCQLRELTGLAPGSACADHEHQSRQDIAHVFLLPITSPLAPGSGSG